MAKSLASGKEIDILREWFAEATPNCTPIPEGFFDKFAATAHDRQIGVSAAYGVICVVGLLANAFLMFLIFAGGKRGMTFRAPSTILIFNLAIADTLFLLTLPFSISHRLNDRWKFGNAMCKFEEGIKFLNYYGSVFFITAMAVDRCFVVSRAGYHRRKKARKCLYVMSVCLWILAVVAVTPLLIYAGVDDHGYCSIMFPRGPTIVGNKSLFVQALHDVECIEDYLYLTSEEFYEAGDSDIVIGGSIQDTIPGSGTLKDYMKFIENGAGVEYDETGGVLCMHPDIKSLHIWLIWNFVVGFVVPFLLITVSYARVMTSQPFAMATSGNKSRTVNTHGEDGNKLIDRSGTNIEISNRARTLLNVLVPCLIIAFFICWFPFHLFHILQIRGVTMSSDSACHVTRDVTFVLAFFNSALNPILNSFFLYNFKQQIKQMSASVSRQLRRLSSRCHYRSGKSKESRGEEGATTDEVTIATSATDLIQTTVGV